MATIQQLIDYACRQLEAGRFEAAEAGFRDALALSPRLAVAHGCLGIIESRRGKWDCAVAAFEEAVRCSPSAPELRNNLGLALGRAAKHGEAIGAYQQSLALKPDFSEAHYNLGLSLQKQGELQAAIDQYQKALFHKPDFHEAFCDLGTAVVETGRLQDAIICFKQAIEICSSYLQAHLNLANVYQCQGQYEEAVKHHRMAIALEPHSADQHAKLADCFYHLGRGEEAIEALCRALEESPDNTEYRIQLAFTLAEHGRAGEGAECLVGMLEADPDNPQLYRHLGLVSLRQHDIDKALQCFHAALAMKPDFVEVKVLIGNALVKIHQAGQGRQWLEQVARANPQLIEAHNSLGVATMQEGAFEQALEHYDRALTCNSYHADTQLNRALLLLLTGKWAEGWRAFEWRLKTKKFGCLAKPQPRWDGRPLGDKTLLVMAEQGFGDTLQFIRYIPLIPREGGRVIFQCPPALLNLISRVKGIDHLLPTGMPCPEEVHWQIPLLSLPLIMKTAVDNVPSSVPYLQTDPALSHHWRGQFSGLPGFKVGIAWQGNPDYPFDSRRSIALGHFELLAPVHGVRLISLQKGPGVEQIEEVGDKLSVLDLGKRLDTSNGAFMDTAAVMESLDLVITSDTALAHLAGALGVRVRVALAYVSDWRWLLNRDDSPWYPTMRLFRQETPGQWNGVFARLEKELRILAEQSAVDAYWRKCGAANV